ADHPGARRVEVGCQTEASSLEAEKTRAVDWVEVQAMQSTLNDAQALLSESRKGEGAGTAGQTEEKEVGSESKPAIVASDEQGDAETGAISGTSVPESELAARAEEAKTAGAADAADAADISIMLSLHPDPDPASPDHLVYHPRLASLGVGASRGCPVAEMQMLVASLMADHDLSPYIIAGIYIALI
ncbi:MAG: hypothetical protein CBC12_11725, partial [Candidatus Puniceispirillum sp. TMED52]